MRIQTAVICLLLAVTSIHCSSSAAEEKASSASKDPTLTQLYVDLVKEGDKRLVNKDYEGALSAFQLASDEDLLGVPNYEVLSRIAEVSCLKGDRKVGEAVLTGFRCTLDVAAGVLPCELDGDPNPDLPADCAERMCDDDYPNFYGKPETTRRVEELRKEADRVAGTCSAKGK